MHALTVILRIKAPFSFLLCSASFTEQFSVFAVSEATGPKEDSLLLKNLWNYSTTDQVHQVFYEKTGSHQNQHVIT